MKQHNFILKELEIGLAEVPHTEPVNRHVNTPMNNDADLFAPISGT